MQIFLIFGGIFYTSNSANALSEFPNHCFVGGTLVKDVYQPAVNGVSGSWSYKAVDQENICLRGGRPAKDCITIVKTTSYSADRLKNNCTYRVIVWACYVDADDPILNCGYGSKQYYTMDMILDPMEDKAFNYYYSINGKEVTSTNATRARIIACTGVDWYAIKVTDVHTGDYECVQQVFD